MQSNIRNLRNRMRITKTLSNDLRNLYLNYSQKLNHVTIGKKKNTRKITR